MTELRPYQRRDVDELCAKITPGKGVLYQLPTGGGKTVCVAELIARLGNHRACMLVHRRELLRQAIHKLAAAGVSASAIASDRRHNPTVRVHVASIDTVSRRIDTLSDWLAALDLVVVDECIAAGALVDTDVGKIPINDIPKSGAKRALSWNGSSYVWRRITGWKSSGRRKTILIRLSDGNSIVCTPDHRLYVEGKWIEARKLKIGAALISHAASVDVVAERNFSSTEGDAEDYSFLATKHQGHGSTGKQNTKIISMPPPCAHAAVQIKSNQRSIRFLIFRRAQAGRTRDICSATINALLGGIYSLTRLSDRSYLGPCSATAASVFQTEGQKTTGWHGPTVNLRLLGSIIKRRFSIAYHQQSKRLQTVGLGQLASDYGRGVFLLSPISLLSFLEKGKRRFHRNGSIRSLMRGWPGGIATMATSIAADALRCFTLRDFPSLRSIYWRSGSTELCMASPSPKAFEICGTSDFKKEQPNVFSSASTNTFQNVCNTSYLYVTSIESYSDEEVFDISVEDTHCFFANGVLVHNCHHAGANTWTRVINAASAAAVIGCTATPWRLDGKPLALHFHDVHQGPSIADLTSAGYLCPAVVHAPPGGIDLRSVKKTAGDYNKLQLAAIMDRPEVTLQAVHHYARFAPGVPTIAFCTSIDHARHAAEQFAAVGWRARSIDGSISIEERDKVFAELASGKIQVLTSCEIVSEGVDVPMVGAAIMLRPTMSAGLWLQQAGRVLRPHRLKKHAIIIDCAKNAIEHGLPDAERKWTLATGLIRPPMGQAVVRCMKRGCWRVVPVNTVTCPSCGTSISRKSRADVEIPTVIGGVHIDRIMATKGHDLARMPFSDRDLRMIAQVKGYRPGWVFWAKETRTNGFGRFSASARSR